MATSLARQTLAERLRGFIKPNSDTTVSDTGDLASGLFRLGNLGSFSGSAWYYTRIVNAVYHNPTGKQCTDQISNAFARAPLKCYKPGDEIRETPISSPLQPLLDNPVPKGLGVMPVSGKMAARRRARDLTLAGMAVTLKIRGDNLVGGQITQLRRLPPQRVTVLGNHHDELLGFIYHDRLGGRLPLLPEWVVYERFPHPDRDYQGFPPALAAGLAAETDNRASRFNLDLLENDGAIPAVVMLEGLTPDQFNEWVAKWEAKQDPGRVRFMGFKKSAGGGKSVELVKIGQTNEELAYDKLRNASQDDIGRALGCPPVVTFNLSHETYANADREIKLWYGTTIWGYWDQTADEETAQLGNEFGVELGYDTRRIPELQESTDTLVERYMTLQSNQNVSINDTNERLGLPRVDWGDAPLEPVLAMQGQPGQPAGDEPPPEPAKPKPKLPPPPPKAARLPRYRRRGPAALAIVPMSPRDSSASRTADRAATQQAERLLAGQVERLLARQARAMGKRIEAKGHPRGRRPRLVFDRTRWDEEATADIGDALAGAAELLGVEQPVDAAALAVALNDETASDLEALNDASHRKSRAADVATGWLQQLEGEPK